MTARTEAQKAAHAEKERLRRQAKKAIDERAGHPLDADPATPDLSDMDTVTLYRHTQTEVVARRTDPDIATPHLDEMTARKGRKVTGTKTPKAARPTRSVVLTEGATQTCTGACHADLPATKFPTVAGGKRGTECRSCRDARRAAKTTTEEVAV